MLFSFRHEQHRNRIVSGLLLVAVVALLAVITSVDRAFHILAGGALVLIAPGFAWSFAFFSPDELPPFDRLLISLPLSLFTAALTLFIGSQLGVPLTSRTMLLLIAVLILLGAIAAAVRLVFSDRSSRPQS